MEFLELLLGYFDYVLLLILIIINGYYWRKLPKINSCFSIIFFLCLFGFILPTISMFVEIRLNSSPGDDAFNLLYTYFRFPVYWVIGLIQIIVVHFSNKRK